MLQHYARKFWITRTLEKFKFVPLTSLASLDNQLASKSAAKAAFRK